MQPTRWEILQLLKRRGKATVDELAKALGMTLMGVRLHLVVVERDGYVQRSTLRQKPGRPALVYSLTPKAEEIFPKRYDLLAEKLLEVLRHDPSHSSTGALEAAATSMAMPLAGQITGPNLEQRVGQATELLDQIGAFASSERVEGGYLVHQHNCLFYRVAERNRDVCRVDQIILQEMLGADATPTECLMDGALRCTHFIRDAGTNHQDTKSPSN